MRVPALGCGGLRSRHTTSASVYFTPAQPKPQPFIFLFFVSSFSSPPLAPSLLAPPRAPGPALLLTPPLAADSLALTPAGAAMVAAAPVNPAPPPLPLGRNSSSPPPEPPRMVAATGRLSSAPRPSRLRPHDSSLSPPGWALPGPLAGRARAERGEWGGSLVPLVGACAHALPRRVHRFSGAKRAPWFARERG